MIIEAEVINQPISGEYTERIYGNEGAWHSHGWTYVKFTNDNNYEWCGVFRGFAKNVAVSEVYDIILVLTSDYLFQLDRGTGNLMEMEDHLQYRDLTVAPNGHFILADYYSLEKVTTSIMNVERIESPIEMDMIEFKGWNHGKLVFTCDEFTNWDRHLTMTYDSESGRIEITNN